MPTVVAFKGKAIDLDEMEVSFRYARNYAGQEQYPIKYYDNGYGTLWVMRDTTGIVGIVRAQTYQDAYECVGDELKRPIDPSDVPDAYDAFDKFYDWLLSKGHLPTNRTREFACRYAPQFFAISTHRANETGAWDDWELGEGYEYQSNASGTGIVSIDLNGESLEPLTGEEMERLEIEMVVTFGE